MMIMVTTNDRILPGGIEDIIFQCTSDWLWLSSQSTIYFFVEQ